MEPKIKQLTKLSLLLALRESYLFCRNLLGLLYHPFKTLRIIFHQQDFSQAILILGLPFYFFLIGFLGIKGLRFLIGAPGSPWGPVAKGLGIILLLLTTLVGLHLFYWLWQVIKIQNSKSKNTELISREKSKTRVDERL